MLDRQNLCADALRSHVREDAAFQIQGSLSPFIERMHRHDAALAALVNENSRHRTIDEAGRMNELWVSGHRAEGAPTGSVKKRRGGKTRPPRRSQKQCPPNQRGPTP